MLKRFLLGLAIALSAQAAQASLIGDSFGFTLQEAGSVTPIISSTPTVSAAPEVVHVDFGKGFFLADLSDTLLTIVMVEFAPLGATTWTFSGLDFSDGSMISGLSPVLTTSAASASFTGNSITVGIDDFTGAGSWIFSVATAPTLIAVPLPAGGTLLIGAAAALALLRRRKSA